MRLIIKTIIEDQNMTIIHLSTFD